MDKRKTKLTDAEAAAMYKAMTEANDRIMKGKRSATKKPATKKPAKPKE